MFSQHALLSFKEKVDNMVVFHVVYLYLITSQCRWL